MKPLAAHITRRKKSLAVLKRRRETINARFEYQVELIKQKYKVEFDVLDALIKTEEKEVAELEERLKA